jgi:formylmethanofuran:tetrahydromethanopterin formyltransferase
MPDLSAKGKTMNDWTMTGTYSEAVREGWARKTVAAAGKSWATHMAKFSGAVVPRERPETDWSRYRACSQVCRAEIGKPCFSRSGRVVDGRPDQAVTLLDQPHKARKLRTVRKAAFSSAPLAR